MERKITQGANSDKSKKVDSESKWCLNLTKHYTIMFIIGQTRKKFSGVPADPQKCSPGRKREITIFLRLSLWKYRYIENALIHPS